MAYLAPNRRNKQQIRLKAKDPLHEAAGLRNRHYGMKGELLSATTPEGTKVSSNMPDPLRPPSPQPISPEMKPNTMPAEGGGMVSAKPATKDPLKPKFNGKPTYSPSKLDEFYDENPHLERGKMSKAGKGEGATDVTGAARKRMGLKKKDPLRESGGYSFT